MMFQVILTLLISGLESPAVDYEDFYPRYKCACESPASSVVEHLVYTEEVGGSKPSLGTILTINIMRVYNKDGTNDTLRKAKAH